MNIIKFIKIIFIKLIIKIKFWYSLKIIWCQNKTHKNCILRKSKKKLMNQI